jgi:hypothetical protein
MVDNKEIKYTIKIVGLEDVETALRGASKAHKEHTSVYEKEQQKRYQLLQKSINQEIREQEKLTNQINRENEKRTAAFEKAQEKRYRAMVREMEMEKTAQSSGNMASWAKGLNVAGHLSQAGGQYQLGHILRATSTLAMAAESAGLTMGTFAVAAGGAALGLGIVAAAGAGLVVGFRNLLAQANMVGKGFADVVMQMGGGRTIQSTLMETVEQERGTALARASVGGRERMSSAELTSKANTLATNPAYGGHNAGEWMGAFAQLGTNTGKQRSILSSSSAMDIIGKTSNMAKVPPQVAAQLYSRVLSQNESQSPEDVNARIRDIIGIGQAGQLSIPEIASGSGRVLSIPSEFFGGDTAANFRSSLAMSSFIKTKTPSGTLEEAGTEQEGFWRAIKGHEAAARGAGIGATFDQRGMITNPNEVLANVLSNPQAAAALIPELGKGREANPFLAHMATGIGIKDNATGPDVKNQVMAALKTRESLTLSEKQLDDQNQESIGIIEKVSAAFNEIYKVIQPVLLDVLKLLAPHLQKFADEMKDMGPQFDSMIKGFLVAAARSEEWSLEIQKIKNWLSMMALVLEMGIGKLTKVVTGGLAGQGMIDRAQKEGDALMAEQNLLDRGIQASKAVQKDLIQSTYTFPAPPTKGTPQYEDLPVTKVPQAPMQQHAATNQFERVLAKFTQDMQQAADKQLEAAKKQDANADSRGATAPGDW